MLPNKPWWFWAQCALVLLFLVPIWAFPHVPLNDWPNHLASIYLLADKGVCNQYIVPNPNLFIPNSTAFTLMASLTPFTGVDFVGRLVLSLYVILLPFSLSYFLKQLDKRLEMLGLSAFAFMYNWLFVMAFINNALSLPLLLLAAGFWLSKRKEPPDIFNHAVFAILSVVVSLTHIASFCALAALIVFMRIWEKEKDFSKFRLDLCGIIPPILLSLPLMADLLGAQAGGRILWGTLNSKLAYVMIMLPNPVPTMIFGVLIISFLAIRIVFVKFVEKKTLPKPDSNIVFWLALSAILFLAYLAIPESLPSWQFAGARIIPYIILFFFSGIFLAFANFEKEEISILAVLFCAFALLTLYMSFTEWSAQVPLVQSVASMSSAFQSGTSVFPLGQGFSETSTYGAAPLFHAWGYWVVAKSVFSPYLFTEKYSPVNYALPNMRGRDNINTWLDNLVYALFTNKYGNNYCAAWDAYYSEIDWNLIGKNYDYVAFRPGKCDADFMPPPQFKLSYNQSGNFVYENTGKN